MLLRVNAKFEPGSVTRTFRMSILYGVNDLHDMPASEYYESENPWTVDSKYSKTTTNHQKMKTNHNI